MSVEPLDRLKFIEDRLISQYSWGQSIKKLSEVLIGDSQDSEDTAQACLLDRWLSNATGEQLKALSDIFWVDSDSFDTEKDLKVSIHLASSMIPAQGTIESIKSILVNAFGFSDIFIREKHPAEFTIEATFLDGSLIGFDYYYLLKYAVETCKCAGVKFSGLTLSNGLPFAFAEYTGQAAGFSDPDIPDSGGYLSDIYEV